MRRSRRFSRRKRLIPDSEARIENTAMPGNSIAISPYRAWLATILHPSVPHREEESNCMTSSAVTNINPAKLTRGNNLLETDDTLLTAYTSLFATILFIASA
ncbi:MAG TPA: hypothetical protein VMX95_04595 [Thermodesulfobacteriota bacterium]|nr:hypothetical protein [Thermodesulfobacteriota bacterium]